MAAPKAYTFSAATLSWIDPAAVLRWAVPEWDRGGEPPSTLTLCEVTETPNCRFAHLIACSILVDGGKIVDRAILPESGLYPRPSFLGTHPQRYPVRRDETEWSSEEAVFVQTVGCRTQAPEVIGGRLGQDVAEGIADAVLDEIIEIGPVVAPLVDPIAGRAGRAIGKQAAEKTLVFPPIWTRIAVTMHADGTSSAEVRASSLFPSMTFYTTEVAPAGLPPSALLWHKRGASYDGVPHYPDWLAHGWGRENPWLVDHP